MSLFSKHSKYHVARLLVLAVMIVPAMLGWMPLLFATDAVNEHGHREFGLRDLPAPPADIKVWLDRGEVTFLIGGERPSVVDPSRSAGAKRGRFDAETRYHMSYSFKSRCRWHWADTSRSQRLAIGVRYEQLELEVEHQVWLREMPELSTFWDSPLVRHELDHIRLSSDPRLAARFATAVKKRDRIELTREQSALVLAAATRRLNHGGRRYRSILNALGSDDAQRWLDEQLQVEFARTLDLVEIRYQELDRQTDHGRGPVPVAGELSEWLSPAE